MLALKHWWWSGLRNKIPVSLHLVHILSGGPMCFISYFAIRTSGNQVARRPHIFLSQPVSKLSRKSGRVIQRLQSHKDIYKIGKLGLVSIAQ